MRRTWIVSLALLLSACGVATRDAAGARNAAATAGGQATALAPVVQTAPGPASSAVRSRAFTVSPAPTTAEVNVRDFGAVGDGVTDDTVSFQAAIAAAATRGYVLAPGGTVSIPPGNYLLTASLTVPLNVSIRGAGFGSLLSFLGTDGIVIAPGGDGQITRFERFRMNGSNTPGTAGIRHPYTASPDRNLMVDSVYIANFEFGAYLQSMWFTTFHKCNIVTPQGIVWKGWNVKVAVEDTHLGRPASVAGFVGPFYGVRQVADDVNEVGKAAEDIQVRNATHIEQYDYAVSLERVLFASIRDSDLDVFQSRGVVVAWALGGLTIANNWISADASSVAANVAGIDLADAAAANNEAKVISGNRISGFAAPISYGIGIGAGHDMAVVRDNYIAGFDEGVRVSRAVGIRVRDNTISANTVPVNWITRARGYQSDNETTTGAVIVPTLGTGSSVVYGNVSTMSADRGDASATLTVGVDEPVQQWASPLTQNRGITLSTGGAAANGSHFRVVRTGLGWGTLDVGGLKLIPSATAAFVDVTFDGTAWRLTGYGLL